MTNEHGTGCIRRPAPKKTRDDIIDDLESGEGVETLLPDGFGDCDFQPESHKPADLAPPICSSCDCPEEKDGKDSNGEQLYK